MESIQDVAGYVFRGLDQRIGTREVASDELACPSLLVSKLQRERDVNATRGGGIGSDGAEANRMNRRGSRHLRTAGRDRRCPSLIYRHTIGKASNSPSPGARGQAEQDRDHSDKRYRYLVSSHVSFSSVRLVPLVELEAVQIHWLD